MVLKKTIVGLVALACFGFDCSHRIARPPEFNPATVIELNTKDKKSLKCEAAKVTTLGSEFYACNDDVDSGLIEGLEYIAAVKQYEREVLGFKITNNYQVYKNNETEKPRKWTWLYIAPKFEIPVDAEESHFFDEPGEYRIKVDKATVLKSDVDDLEDEQAYYKSLGFDTFLFSSTHFVIVGKSSGPNVTPQFLERKPAPLAKTVIHEDLHVHIDLEHIIEESIATILGRGGTIDFTARHFGMSSDDYKAAKKQLKKWLDYSHFINKYHTKLNELYAKDIPDKEKLEEKKRIIKQANKENAAYVVNNAVLWQKWTYTKHFPLVHRLYEKINDMGTLAKILLKTPAEEKKAVKYLESFLK